MKRKTALKINMYFWLITGLFYLTFGFFFFISPTQILNKLILTLSIVFISNASLQLLMAIIRKNRAKYFNKFLHFIIDTFTGIFMINNLSFTRNSLVILFGLYMFCNSILDFINFYLYCKENVNKERGFIFLQALVTLIIGLLTIFSPKKHVHYAVIMIGIYSLLLGLDNIFEFLRIAIPSKTKTKIKKGIHIPMLEVFEMFVPQWAINMINDLLSNEKRKNNAMNSLLLSSNKRNNKKPDIYIVIHLAKTGSAKFGHVDISYKGKTYSYGNYNLHNRKLYDTIGDGIIMVANTKEYMEYLITTKNRYLVTFGLEVTDDEKIRIEQNIKALLKNTTEYHSDLELAEMSGNENKDFYDMSSELYKLASAKFYKVNSGKYAKFFVVKSNCVMVAEHILGTGRGEPIININGVITPGTYLDYLNRSFEDPYSNVISRTVYTKNNINELDL